MTRFNSSFFLSQGGMYIIQGQEGKIKGSLCPLHEEARMIRLNSSFFSLSGWHDVQGQVQRQEDPLPLQHRKCKFNKLKGVVMCNFLCFVQDIQMLIRKADGHKTTLMFKACLTVPRVLHQHHRELPQSLFKGGQSPQRRRSV